MTTLWMHCRKGLQVVPFNYELFHSRRPIWQLLTRNNASWQLKYPMHITHQYRQGKWVAPLELWKQTSTTRFKTLIGWKITLQILQISIFRLQWWSSPSLRMLSLSNLPTQLHALTSTQLQSLVTQAHMWTTLLYWRQYKLSDKLLQTSPLTRCFPSQANARQFSVFFDALNICDCLPFLALYNTMTHLTTYSTTQLFI